MYSVKDNQRRILRRLQNITPFEQFTKLYKPLTYIPVNIKLNDVPLCHVYIVFYEGRIIF